MEINEIDEPEFNVKKEGYYFVNKRYSGTIIYHDGYILYETENTLNLLQIKIIIKRDKEENLQDETVLGWYEVKI